MNAINQYIKRHDLYLRNFLDTQDIPASNLKHAINYVIFSGGKRLRPLLVYMSGELLHTNPDCLDIIAGAIELMHNYSLVHDDLPGMDNDDMRRGRPSCHRQFDEATAILVGDSLQVMAIDLLLNQLPSLMSHEKAIKIIQILITASGIHGMISGQYLDYYDLKQPGVAESQVRYIHNLKTGKLITACIDMVIAASAENHAAVIALRHYAMNLGLVFQIQDDYLDAYAAISTLGKQSASDARNAKSTFVNYYSRAELFKLIENYYQESLDALQYFADSAKILQEFTLDLKLRC